MQWHTTRNFNRDRALGSYSPISPAIPPSMEADMLHRRIGFVIGFLVFLILIVMLPPAIQQSREAARRTQSRSNLKQIGLALSDYHESLRHLPPGGTFDNDGTGIHGWMTLFMPYFESSPLYSRIDLSQPWNSPHNAGWLRIHISVFQVPGETVQFDDCGFSLAHYSANAHLFAANSAAQLKDLESTANVFLAAELRGDFVPWSCPYNWRLLRSLNSSPPIYGRYGGFGAHFLFADTHVEFIATEAIPIRLSQICGPDLSGYGSMPASIVRPPSFECPQEILAPDFEKFNK